MYDILHCIYNSSFESLVTDKSKELFEEFCEEYNNGELVSMYYEGIPLEVRETTLKSQHK